MKAEIEARLEVNLRRVQRLMELYTASSSGQGRRQVAQTDLLRAAIVLLHATLEDVVRSMSEWKLPLVRDNKIFGDINLAGTKSSKFTLADIASHRGKSIDDLIRESVLESLKRSNYNNPGEIEQAIEAVGLSKNLLDPYRSLLGPMIQRRHWIVHRADQNVASGSGHHPTQTIDKATVQEWYDAVQNFSKGLLAAC